PTANAQKKASWHQCGRGGGSLRDDGRMIAHHRARYAGAEPQALGCLRNCADDGPGEWTLALFVNPRMEVVGNEGEFEAGRFCLLSEANELARAVLLAGKRVTEFRHGAWRATVMPGPVRMPKELCISADLCTIAQLCRFHGRLRDDCAQICRWRQT